MPRNTFHETNKYKKNCASAAGLCVCRERGGAAAAVLLVLRALQPPIFAPAAKLNDDVDDKHGGVCGEK